MGVMQLGHTTDLNAVIDEHSIYSASGYLLDKMRGNSVFPAAFK